MGNIRNLSLVIFMAVNVWAQMPHEVLLLVNKQSQASLQVANAYAASRQIPKCNLVYLNIPESAYGGSATISPDEFTALIWNPACDAIKERHLEDQILAWVYSVDFPIRIKTHKSDRKQMSVSGLTFLRNKMPDLSVVEKGQYLSKLFAGPNDHLKFYLNSMSLGTAKTGLGMAVHVPPEAAWIQSGLGVRMPIPSMMLGYVGENGNDVETVLENIRRGLKSDYSGQRNGIYFVVSEDVRSTCREWQYKPAVEELKTRGVAAGISTNFPAGKSNVMGVMVGAEQLDPLSIKSFAPGAMAEHLTSWSAEFQRPQTKLTEWIKSGATGSAGSVVEPYSNPNKFPSARFFTHYASGCTMLESFYQSIACPLQCLLLGDPLAKPYALPLSVKVLGAERIDSSFTYLASVSSSIRGVEFLYSFLLDGKQVQRTSSDNSIMLSVDNLSDGYHELRAVASINHPVRFSASSNKSILVNRKGRSVHILPDVARRGTFKHAIRVKVEGEEHPEKLKLISGVMELDTCSYSCDAELIFDEKVLGEGPNRIRVVAVYADGMEVSSIPMSFTIKFSPEKESP
ncbi:MAG TPA: hypothetical protein VIR63_05230 [Pontiella sp.]